MTRQLTRQSRLLISAALMAVSVPSANADDLLPLRQGIFVDRQVACDQRSNATVLSFWGDRLNSSRVIGVIEKVQKQKQAHIVTLSQTDIGGAAAGDATLVMFIAGAETFYIESSYGNQHYRWCGKSMF